MEIIILAEIYIHVKLFFSHTQTIFEHALKWLTRTGRKLLASSIFSVVRAPLLPFLTLDPSVGHMCALPLPPPVYNREGFCLFFWKDMVLYWKLHLLIKLTNLHSEFLSPFPCANFYFPRYLVRMFFSLMFSTRVFLYCIILLISCPTF